MCSVVCMYIATQCKQSLFVHDLHLKQYRVVWMYIYKQAYNHTFHSPSAIQYSIQVYEIFQYFANKIGNSRFSSGLRFTQVPSIKLAFSRYSRAVQVLIVSLQWLQEYSRAVRTEVTTWCWPDPQALDFPLLSLCHCQQVVYPPFQNKLLSKKLTSDTQF